MNKLKEIEVRQCLKFFTFIKQEFNYFSQKIQNKTYKFYTTYRWHYYLPPLYKCLVNPTNKENSFHRWILLKWELFPLPFKQKPVSEEIKKRFAENMAFQTRVMDKLTSRVEDYKYYCGIIKAKTGMWKTHLIMDIIEYFQMNTLILVSNKKLMSEMLEKFENLSNYIPWQYGDWKKEIKPITIMTKSSYLKVDKKELQDFKWVIVDELQTGFSPKFRNKFNMDFDEKEIFFYWLSATPSTNEFDQDNMEKYYGKTIEVEKAYDFIPDFTFIDYYHPKLWEWEHYSELKQVLIDDENRLSEQLDFIDNNLSKKCSLILCDRLEEIENYHKYYNENYSHYIIKITGETKIEDDKKQLETALKWDKPILIIWSIQKTATGFDFPIIDTVFVFSSIKFENTVIQSVGRALRKYPWKIWASIYLWNDMPILKKQRQQKSSAIKKEYWVNKINCITLNKEYYNNNIALEF